MMGFEMTKFSKWLHSNSNCRSLLELAVIHEYPEEGAFFSRKCHAWRDCCYSWSESSSDNREISPRSRPYHPEAFWLSSPGWVFFGAEYKIIMIFFPSLLSLHPFNPSHLQCYFPKIYQKLEVGVWKCSAAARHLVTSQWSKQLLRIFGIELRWGWVFLDRT